jgi:hypothetical protein
VWRKLRRLGVAQLADGLVALPADARSREQLEWVAGEVRDASGTAALWLARPASVAQERTLAESPLLELRSTETSSARPRSRGASLTPIGGGRPSGSAPSSAASGAETSPLPQSGTRP